MRSIKGLAWLILLFFLTLPLPSFSQEKVEMEVRDIIVDRTTGSPILILQDRKRTMALPIYIGRNEAQAILLEIGNIGRIRPLTHDLLYNILKGLHIKVEKVVVNDLRNDTYYATIYLISGKDVVEIDSRPSDAIALALRAKSPIYVLSSVLNRAPVISLKKEDVVEIWGIGFQDLTPDLASYFGLREAKGVLVAYRKVLSSPLIDGDVVLKIGGDRIRDLRDLKEKARRLKRGSVTRITLLREGRVIDVPFPLP